ncbi:MAG: DNA topoisomerase (ATP-hydrolyzing) [Lachnospiraceae bacterium]|nr:DNA topoisomerase (ATP-hydrolyzing) [Lachnospiraceae bacterium]
MTTKDQSIIQLDFSDEMKNSYRDYAVSVIISRALPDVRDGLKPVQRRILYAMTELGLAPDKPHRKSARIVGDTMGKYHPHGDSSIYDALVHMTEDYSLNLPLVDGHGNFGSIDGDSAAAMRYTEARLSAGALTLLENLDKGLVPFGPNFDESEKEPLVLPATLPNLLINGTTGIAVGMATNIPPHNVSEVIDGTVALIKNPDITTKGLMKYIKGPDFPTGAMITNADSIEQIYNTGEGKLTIRAKTEIENSDNGRKNIVITEIPYTVAGNKTKLLESLVALTKDKVFDEIYDVRDESSKEGIRLVIEVKKDRNIENLLNGLYKKTAMEDTYGVNMLAVKDKQPITFTLKHMLQEFVLFQEELYTKEYEHLLAKAKDRLEIVNGLIKATDVIDLIIEILRGSQSVKQAKSCLIDGITEGITFRSKKSEKDAATLSFTERQADAILAMPLSRLIGLELLKLHQEKDVLDDNIAQYLVILNNKEELDKTIIARLKRYKKQFGVPRKTELANVSQVKYVEEIKEEDIYVLIDRFGYIKSVDATSYSRLSAETLNDYAHIVCMRNTDRLCVFSSAGNMYQIKAMNIPKGRSRDKGVLIQSLCKIGHEDALLYVDAETLFNSQLLFTTAYGFVKLVSGIEFDTNRLAITSTKLDENDHLAGVTLLTVEDAIAQDRKVIMITKDGLSLGFPLTEVSELKKTSRGVKGIALEKEDLVEYSSVVTPDCEEVTFEQTKYNPKKIRNRKRGAKGQKAQIRLS